VNRAELPEVFNEEQLLEKLKAARRRRAKGEA